MLNVYFAPMEGITGHLFRNAYEAVFPNTAIKYFSPFIASGVKKGVAGKDLRELAPENNKSYRLVPQLLTNDPADFVTTAAALSALGYDEIDLNLGCPSKTVVSKARGAGLLADPDRLCRLLDAAFSFCDTKGLRLSIKTRLGMAQEDEFIRLLSIYDSYPVSELIVHLRLCTDYYKLPCRPQWFDYAREHSRLKLVYNGDLISRADVEKVSSSYPDTEAVMIGRGFLMRPWMLEDSVKDVQSMFLTDEMQEAKKKLWAYHDLLYSAYQREMCGDTNVLFKMKELWAYLGESFDTISPDRGRENKKALKEIKKSRRLADYEGALCRLGRIRQ